LADNHATGRDGSGSRSPRGARIAAGLALVASVLVACQLRQADPIRPSPQVIELVGVIKRTAVDETRTRFELEDGRIWQRPTAEFRVAYDRGGDGSLLVIGRDQEGTYVVIAGGIEGLPPECRWVVGPDGRDWGDSVESIGLLWPKSPRFLRLPSTIAVGEVYPSRTRFCLDEQGRTSNTAVPT
jgi:hypothetical protein